MESPGRLQDYQQESKEIRMKHILYREWVYICAAFVLVTSAAYAVSTFNRGFFTAVDEGYFLIKLKEAYEASTITGKSQWNLIAIHWFPYLDLTSKVNSYIATCILRSITILFLTTTCCIRYKKERVFRYFTIIVLVYYIFEQDFGLNYVPMQNAVLSWALCSYLLFQKYENRCAKDLLLVVCGFLLCLSGFIVVTGAIAVTPLFVIMIIVNARNNKPRIFSNLFFFVIGCFLSLVYINFIVCPLKDIYKAMMDTANYISKSGHGYDGLSFLRQYLVFSCRLSIIIIYLVGVYYISSFFKNKMVSSAIYILAAILYYVASPVMGPSTKYMLLVGVVSIPLFFSNNVISLFERLTLSEKELLYLFLFLFPILAPLGTNLPLEARLHNYIVSWLFIYFSYEYEPRFEKYHVLVAPSLILLFVMPIYGLIKLNWNYTDNFHFIKGNKNFSELSITSNQANYLNNLYEIIEKYRYQPGKSVLFTTMYDYSTLYAIDAVNSTNFYHTENFHYFDKSKMISPDFVILCPRDSAILSEELKAMPWGWPEEFDTYDIGNPETKGELTEMLPDDLLENRKLYCRRRLKVKN